MPFTIQLHKHTESETAIRIEVVKDTVTFYFTNPHSVEAARADRTKFCWLFNDDSAETDAFNAHRTPMLHSIDKQDDSLHAKRHHMHFGQLREYHWHLQFKKEVDVAILKEVVSRIHWEYRKAGEGKLISKVFSDYLHEHATSSTYEHDEAHDQELTEHELRSLAANSMDDLVMLTPTDYEAFCENGMQSLADEVQEHVRERLEWRAMQA